jgi:lysophospholipase L1-like esterase
MVRLRNIKQIHVLLLCMLIAVSASAQSTIDFTYKTYGLESEVDNVIHNAFHLEDFFEHLYQLKAGNDNKVSIIHIGDSHIQADYMTAIVRRNFQQNFGNAGRGLVVPFRVAGTNEPSNFKTTSSVIWNAKRCVHIDQPLPIGIGGVTINTDVPNAKMTIYMNDLWQDYAFNSITLFYQKDITSFCFSVRDTVNKELAFIGGVANDALVNHSRITLPEPVGAVSLETIKILPAQREATIFGVSFENEQSGILYHAVGVNGAKYAHYNAAKFFAQQTSVLTPEVFIISLGTNESLDYPYLDRNFFHHVEKLITSLQDQNTVAKFILVTPPDAYKKKVKRNPGIQLIRKQILEYAVENGLAFWDMHAVGGGENSADAWKSAGLLRNDGVHFSRDGYEYQGNLLYSAVIKGYNQYVSLRHP